MTTKRQAASDSDIEQPGGAPQAAESPAGEVEAPEADLATALAEANAKADEHWNQYLRAVAELENLRKRVGRDLEHAHKFAIERFAGELLGVKDTLEMGLEAAASADVDTLREGKAATLRLLAKVFENHGISEVDPAGEPFDPELHEAMATQESADVEPNTVLQVVQKGYVLNGRLLRPARVIVARAKEQTAGGSKA